MQRIVVKTADDDDEGRGRREVETHQKPASRDEDDCVVPIRGWSVRQGYVQDLYIYIEWAPHGSLYNIVENFKKRNRLIPEVFIWIVVQSLVKACLLCERSHLIHSDISEYKHFRNRFIPFRNRLDLALTPRHSS
jgi:hypothetical protein